jgi:CubicO group peptidase (beta-lactamase class C family)
MTGAPGSVVSHRGDRDDGAVPRVLGELLTVITCAAVALLAVPLPANADPVPTAPGPAVIDRYLADALAATGMPGMAVAITHGPDVVHLAGFGTDGRGGPVTPRTQFRIASLSKSFTAAAVLQLASRGRIGLDDPVRDHLPAFGVADPDASARITVRHLLNQTSGIADRGFPGVTSDDDDLRRRVAALRTARPVSPPGREFHYSDPNYQVLALLIEVVTGRPWEWYLEREVFAPLGMADTVATAVADEAVGVAPHLARGHVLLFGRPVARPELDGLVAGSTGVVSTAQDTARWLIAQTTGGGPILPPDAVAAMHTPPAGVPGGYAMGWQVVTPEHGPRRVEHTGVLSTFSAVQVLLPDTGYGFALLYDGYSATADTAGITAGLAALLTGAGDAAPPRSTVLMSGVIGGACVVVLALRTRSLVRLGRWRRHRAGRSWWRSAPGLLWLVLPVGLLVGLVPLVATSTDRVFTFWQLCLAMPDVVVLLAVAAITGTVLAVARIAALVSARGSPGGPSAG